MKATICLRRSKTIVATGEGSFEGGARAVQSFAIRTQIRAVDGSSKGNRTSAGALVGLFGHIRKLGYYLDTYGSR